MILAQQGIKIPENNKFWHDKPTKYKYKDCYGRTLKDI